MPVSYFFNAFLSIFFTPPPFVLSVQALSAIAYKPVKKAHISAIISRHSKRKKSKNQRL